MATLSSSWKPTVSSANRAPSPVDQSRSPLSRPSSPSPQAGESTTSIAWRNALNSYRKSLSEKDFNRIMIPSGPEDVATEIEKWQCRQSASSYARVAAAVRAGVGRMQRFSASIDMLAQGSPSPGCLLWGSIKFVLTIVQGAAEEYDKLCQALSRMVDCLPQIEVYTETFLDSEIVRACVSAFYVSTLRFWTRACKFYRRHKLLNFVRSVWNDFDAEFSELEISMIENRDRVERAAFAEHIGQSKVARVQQQSVNHRLLAAQNTAREKEITIWLAPAAYDVSYYRTDLANARALRHPKSCQWIFEKEEMGHLLGAASNGAGNQAHEESFLWIHAKPGAGKTILSSRLIDHYTFEDDRFQREKVFYFFCKSTDADKNNATVVIRSLLYQLYKSTKDEETHMKLTTDVEQALHKSGKRQAVDYASIWAIFADNVKGTSRILIVLDALDECQDSEQLIQGLKSLLCSDLIKVIATSRKEAHILTHMRDTLSLEITAEDINSDIVAYVEAKVLGSPRLSHSMVRDRVITRLSTGHSGMFLWVYLMLKELKSCFSMTQVQGVLANLPKGLDGIYQSILQRLRDNLPAASLDLCYKVLTWVVSAIRPLKVDELKHALSLHHEIEGDTLLFEYAEKDIELVCGSLVSIRQGKLQVIHLTVKEFLIFAHRPQYSTYSDLLIDPAKASFQLTLACLKCIKVSCNDSLVDLDARQARLDIELGNEAVTQRQRQAPLAEYASLTWMVHLTDCDESQVIGVSKAFQTTFDSPSTFYWVEASMAFQPDSVLRLIAGLEEVIEYVSGLSPEKWPRSEASCVFFANWCHAIRNVFVEYGSILSHRPWEVHLLDLDTSFSKIRQFYKKFANTARRDITLRINGYDSPRSCRPEVQACNQLQQGGHILDSSIFFIHDERRRLYIWGERDIDFKNARLFVQNAVTGQRLPPAVKLDGESGRRGYVNSYGLSPSGEYIVVVYTVYRAGGKNPESMDRQSHTLIWQINEDVSFKRRMSNDSWARIVFSHQCKTGLFEPTNSVVFQDEGYCLTPSGEIDLASGSRRPLSSCLPGGFVPVESVKDVFGSFFSQDGKYFFISEIVHGGISGVSGTFRAKRVALFTEASEYLCVWKDSRRRLAAVSPSGRFLILSKAELGDVDEALYLYDVETSKNFQLPFVEPLNYWEARYRFVKDEMELVVFISCEIHGIYTMYVLIWSDLQSRPFLKSYGKLKLDDMLDPAQIHVNDDESSALVVLESRVIQRVEFHNHVTFPDAADVNDDYPCTLSQVSRDGVRWAQLRYGQDKAQLQMTDVSAAMGPIHRLELELYPCDEPQSLAVSFSPDLCVLVVGAQVFSIAEGIHGLTSTSFTIEGLPELLERHRTRLMPRHWCQLRCLISPCKSHVIFISPGDPNEREAAPSTTYAFRIDLVSRSSVGVDLHLPENLTYISADFHPSEHLMLLSYSSSSTSDVQVVEEESPLQMFIVELQGLEMKPIGLPKGELFTKRVKDYWTRSGSPPQAVFSDCGTFVLMPLGFTLRSPCYVIHHVNADLVTTRYIPLTYPYSDTKRLTPSGEYMIETKEVDSTSYRLVSRKLPKGDLCVEDFDVSGRDQDDQRVYLDNFICCSSNLADSERYLLLGENDNVKMRLLIAPREGRALEIKPLSLTFNEAKRRLEIEWEKRQALGEKEIEETGKQSAAVEEDKNGNKRGELVSDR